MAWHGPHQPAKKSTRTGRSAASTSSAKLLSLTWRTAWASACLGHRVHSRLLTEQSRTTRRNSAISASAVLNAGHGVVEPCRIGADAGQNQHSLHAHGEKAGEAGGVARAEAISPRACAVRMALTKACSNRSRPRAAWQARSGSRSASSIEQLVSMQPLRSRSRAGGPGDVAEDGDDRRPTRPRARAAARAARPCRSRDSGPSAFRNSARLSPKAPYRLPRPRPVACSSSASVVPSKPLARNRARGPPPAPRTRRTRAASPSDPIRFPKPHVAFLTVHSRTR